MCRTETKTPEVCFICRGCDVKRIIESPNHLLHRLPSLCRNNTQSGELLSGSSIIQLLSAWMTASLLCPASPVLFCYSFPLLCLTSIMILFCHDNDFFWSPLLLGCEGSVFVPAAPPPSHTLPSINLFSFLSPPHTPKYVLHRCVTFYCPLVEGQNQKKKKKIS